MEAQRVSELLAQRHAEAVGRRVQDVVEELRRQTTPLDPPVLRYVYTVIRQTEPSPLRDVMLSITWRSNNNT